MKASKVQSAVPDKLVKADVYGAAAPVSKPLNSQPSAADATKTVVSDIIRRSTGLVDNLIADAITGDLSSKGVKDLLRAEFPDIKNTLDGLKGNVIREFASSLGIKPAFIDKAMAIGSHPSKQAMESLLTEQFPQIKIIHQQLDPTGNTDSIYGLFEATRTTVKNLKDIDTSREILGMVDQIVSDQTVGNYFNLTRELKALSSVIRVASAYNVPEAIDKAINKAQPENKPALLIEAFYAAAIAGDFDTLVRFSTFDLSGLKAKHPAIVRNILEGYKSPIAANSTRLASILSILHGIDPTWLIRDGIVIYDNICYASSDMRKLLALDPAIGPLALTASYFRPESIDVSLAGRLPWVPRL
jgi:hypothetical protein